MAKSFNTKNEIVEEFENLCSDFKKYLKGGLSVDDTYFFGKTLEQYYTQLKAFEKEEKVTEENTQKSIITPAVEDALTLFLFNK